MSAAATTLTPAERIYLDGLVARGVWFDERHDGRTSLGRTQRALVRAKLAMFNGSGRVFIVTDRGCALMGAARHDDASKHGYGDA